MTRIDCRRRAIFIYDSQLWAAGSGPKLQFPTTAFVDDEIGEPLLLISRLAGNASGIF